MARKYIIPTQAKNDEEFLDEIFDRLKLKFETTVISILTERDELRNVCLAWLSWNDNDPPLNSERNQIRHHKIIVKTRKILKGSCSNG